VTHKPASETPKPAIPRGLKPAGRRFLRELYSTYDFAPHPELVAIAEAAARTLDICARLQADVDQADSLVAKGSRGQDTPIVALAELRQYRGLFNSLVGRLTAAVVDAPGAQQERDGAGKLTRSEVGKIAASARWAARYGL
jgi:hypothetical protein